ncbi:MAG: 2-oxo acid dehydrogenase subunit E2 [Candidatus Sumerlaeaceae bacterium]|nr:2-oxo acid dehydrogenase subunit E2 [Candidatus Sumerlaeaceae bacterium]
MVEITMPQLSESMAEGRLLRWCVSVGSPVKAGDVIAEVETDKANMEIEVLEDGIITGLRASPGDFVPVGAVIATVEPAAVQPESNAMGNDDEDSEYILDEADQPAPAPAEPAGQADAAPAAPLVSPIAARLAAMYNVDLTTVTGSGPGGRIMKEDVLARRSGYPRDEGFAPVPPEVDQRASATAGMVEPAETPEPEAEPPADSPEVLEDMFGGIPKDPDTAPPATGLIAVPPAPESPAVQDPPQVADKHGASNHPETLAPRPVSGLACASAEVSAEDVLRSLPVLQAVLGDDWADVDPDGFLVPVCVRAAALALSLSGRAPEGASVALGVTTDKGIHFPVLRRAAAIPMRSLIEACAALPARTRRGELTAADLGGADLALVFLGRHGLDTLTGMTGPDAIPLMALGSVTERPMVRNGATMAARTMMVTLTFDPGCVPAPAAFAIMREFRRIVENPLLLTLA